ncbi:hypothetical protein ACOMHN_024493 [Nucella lapillus]
MPSDPKGYGKRRKRRRFCGNQHKKAKTDCRESENECEVSVESVEEDFVRVDTSIDSQRGYSGSKRSTTSVTPTQSEIKLFNRYCKADQSSSSSSDSEVAIAVCVFNDGANTLGHILEKLGLSVGLFTERFLHAKDTSRILTAQRRAPMATKEYRRRKRLQRLGREEELAELEGFPYQAGCY